MEEEKVCFLNKTRCRTDCKLNHDGTCCFEDYEDHLNVISTFIIHLKAKEDARSKE